MTTPDRPRRCSFLLLAASLTACAALPDKDVDADGSDSVTEELRQGNARRPSTVVPVAYGQVVTTRLTHKVQFRGFTFAGVRLFSSAGVCMPCVVCPHPSTWALF